MFPLHFVGKGIRRKSSSDYKDPSKLAIVFALDKNKREIFAFSQVKWQKKKLKS